MHIIYIYFCCFMITHKYEPIDESRGKLFERNALSGVRLISGTADGGT